MIPASVIEDIKARCEIEEVIGSYVPLKRAGSNMTGRCPFHTEKTPSFTVFTGGQNFYCFGCGAGGDVITFIMRAENLTYPDAVRFLAKRCNIVIPEDEREGERTVRRARLYDMNRDAARFFRDRLFNSPDGQAARRYIEKRGLSGATVKHFGLGFAPDSFSDLRNHLRSLGYTGEEMTAGWLCGVSEKTGNLYDKFRNRLMFPVIDVSGNVIAFSGRVLDDSKPKYLNSGDTPAFKKSRNLFALNYAKAHCADEMILCEGNLDVIAMHQAGFENAVASLGTALTPEQCRIMAKYTKRVVIAYDSDDAGRRAAQKAMRLLDDAGLDVRVLNMTGAKDPDEYIKTFGADKFRALLGASKTGFEYRLDGVLAKHDISVTEEKIKATEELCAIIAAVYSQSARDVYIGRVSDILEIPKDSIKNDVERTIRRRRREEKQQEKTDLLRVSSGLSDRINPDAAKNIRIAKLEEAVLGMLLLHPEYLKAGSKGAALLNENAFYTVFARRIYEKIAVVYAETGQADIAHFGETFSADEIGRIVKMQIDRKKLSNNSEALFLQTAADLCEAIEAERAKGSGGLEEIEKMMSRKRKST